MKQKIPSATPTRKLGAALLASALIWPAIADACDVGIVSFSYSASGRPIIWKNRDDSNSYDQGATYYSATMPKIGGHVCLEEVFVGQKTCSGGANEAGFAIANASVYADTNFEELINQDATLIKEALQQCDTVACFEQKMENWQFSHGKAAVLNSNFAVMDAYGNAALYEVHAPLASSPQKAQFIKHDAVINRFANHTNYNSFIDNPGMERKERATYLIGTLINNGQMGPTQMMQRVAKDICGQITDQPTTRFPTNKCISRAQTTAGMVIEGVTPGQDPRLTTIWLNLGEPSVGIFAPVFPAAHSVPDTMKMDLFGFSKLNKAIVNNEFHVYDNNGAINDLLPSPWMDTTVNLDKLQPIRDKANVIEAQAWQDTAAFLGPMRGNAALITPEKLQAFQLVTNHFIYQNYKASSSKGYNVFSLWYIITHPWEFLRRIRMAGIDFWINRNDMGQDTLNAVQVNIAYLRRQLPLELQALKVFLAFD